jgi:hypothetical protein
MHTSRILRFKDLSTVRYVASVERLYDTEHRLPLKIHYILWGRILCVWKGTRGGFQFLIIRPPNCYIEIDMS